MPSSSEERRELWGVSEELASAYLRERGYRLTREWSWRVPEGHTPTTFECSAADFLMDEWDYGGLEFGKVG